MSQTMVVRYMAPDEFCAELQEATPNVEGVVRITGEHRRGDLPITRLYLRAGYLRRAEGVLILTNLIAYCGDLWDAGKADDAVWARYERIKAQVEAAARDVGAAIRTGLYEPTTQGA